MGVSTNYYTICGIKAKWNDEFYDCIEELKESEDADIPFILFRGRGEKYIILGVVIYDSGDLRWGDLNEECVIIDLESLPEMEKTYKEKFVDKFPQYAHLVAEKFSLMTFVHYS